MFRKTKFMVFVIGRRGTEHIYRLFIVFILGLPGSSPPNLNKSG